MKVCVGGTFNIFHKGHKKLLDKAFQIAGKSGVVYVGLIQGKMLAKKKFVISYEDREKEIKKYLRLAGYGNQIVIKPIHDIYGLAVDLDLDAIIVSPETTINAENINKERVKIGKKSLKIIQIPFVLAEDNKPISSTRIYNKEINKEGRVLIQ